MTAALKKVIPDSGMWEGALALANVLDRMAEGDGFVKRSKFVGGLEEIGLNGEQILSGLLATGLVAQGKLVSGDGDELVCIGLTQEGRLAVLHATSCL